MDTMDTKIIFTVLFACCQVFGLLGIILLIVALTNFNSKLTNVGNFDWTTDKSGIHKLLMPIGLVYLSGTAAAFFRGLTCFERLHVKYLHGCLQGVSFVLSVIGLVAIFDVKTTHLTTLHGWLGLIIVILFAGMWFFSLLGYLYPQATESVRQSTIPYHRKCGLVIFSLSVINTLIGINGSTNTFIAQYFNSILSEFILSGVFLLLFGITTIVIVLMKCFKRGQELY